MLRIHFTSEDLMRVRLAPGADPWWEAMLSARQIDLLGGPLVYDEWRSQVRSALCSEAREYLRVAPSGRLGLRTSAGGGADLIEGRDAALRAYHEQAIAPYWSVLRREVDADIATRARILTSAGTAALLASTHPSITWREPVLSIDSSVERDVYLAGRGLTVQPAFFCWRSPLALSGPGFAPVLVCPIPHRMSSLRSSGTDEHERALAALLGRTRGAVLVALTYGASTSELARQLGVSRPSASEHVGVLREAGLVTSRRERTSVWHTLTPLGHAVLDAGTAPPDAGQRSRVRARA
ncbi:winged helix-turn-helix domain-containing protein [Kribbella sp. NPDC051770]|uniref:ArsR/SmtB family transcription factor n=1 Tax=Kribbella sp. NPDC051770 TaxID=3155413 RepID=UPI003418E167